MNTTMLVIGTLFATLVGLFGAVQPDWDRTGTTPNSAKKESSQLLGLQEVASFGVSPAEDKGFEPSTGCPALDFESSC